MKSSQFEAKTFGVGELISQRKLFRVPAHQRSYAWDKESVEEILMDIETALEIEASDYFIGLVVIQSSPKGEWVLLDGQQRLTTVSLIFAAIRYWFLNWGLEADAQQIHHEYLGVRRLGGTLSSRMLLNPENQPVFEIAAIEAASDTVLIERVGAQSKAGSNKLLLSAALRSRKWVKEYAEVGDQNDKAAFASRLYELARFLESRLKVIAVEVSSDVDAYVLFESLNDRGVALSALDLIKNYIFSRAPSEIDKWEELLGLLGDENPEDFLKIFWTSRYGLIQKSQIFRGVKASFGTEDQVRELVAQMIEDANILAALGDDDHPLWGHFPAVIRDQAYLLRSLDSKQSRPLLIAILRQIDDWNLIQSCFRLITTAIVRFQVIGKGRTGVVEKVFGRLCQLIAAGKLTDVYPFREAISELITQDDVFVEAYKKHEDKKYSRIVYLLAADSAARVKTEYTEALQLTRSYFDRYRVSGIFSSDNGVAPSVAARIGNFHLVDREDPHGRLDPLPAINDGGGNAEEIINHRSTQLAMQASGIWTIGAA